MENNDKGAIAASAIGAGILAALALWASRPVRGAPPPPPPPPPPAPNLSNITIKSYIQGVSGPTSIGGTYAIIAGCSSGLVFTGPYAPLPDVSQVRTQGQFVPNEGILYVHDNADHCYWFAIASPAGSGLGVRRHEVWINGELRHSQDHNIGSELAPVFYGGPQYSLFHGNNVEWRVYFGQVE